VCFEKKSSDSFAFCFTPVSYFSNPLKLTEEKLPTVQFKINCLQIERKKILIILL